MKMPNGLVDGAKVVAELRESCISARDAVVYAERVLHVRQQPHRFLQLADAQLKMDHP